MSQESSLPIVSNCDNCGACCRNQESPPGYVHLVVNEVDMDDEAYVQWPDDEDVRRAKEMPAELIDEIRQYIANGCRHANSPACLWYDPIHKNCKHHEWRPGICRDFEVGSE